MHRDASDIVLFAKGAPEELLPQGPVDRVRRRGDEFADARPAAPPLPRPPPRWRIVAYACWPSAYRVLPAPTPWRTLTRSWY